MPTRGPIVLETDFGTSDGFVGVLKGVIVGINPGARIVDLTHGIDPQDVGGAAFVLWSSYRYFPPTSVFVAVVDPGVGSYRRGIAVETPHGTFVGPDNGIFTPTLDDLGGADHPAIRAFELANRDLWLPEPSATFHARDIFAPVAARLSLGIPIEELGPRAGGLVWLDSPRPQLSAEEAEGVVIRIDRFGNLITNLRPEHLRRLGDLDFLATEDTAEDLIIEVKGAEVAGLRPFYSAGSGLGAIVGSNGLIELAVTGGSAAAELGAEVGTRVRVRRRGAR